MLLLGALLLLSHSLVANGHWRDPWCEHIPYSMPDTPRCVTCKQDLPQAFGFDGSNPRNESTLSPVWINITLAELGRNWAVTNLNGIFSAHALALMCVLALPDVSSIQHFTGNSSTIATAMNKYGLEIYRINLWYNTPVTTEAVLESFLATRAKHIHVMQTGNAKVAEDGALIDPETFVPPADQPLDTDMWDCFLSGMLELVDSPAQAPIPHVLPPMQHVISQWQMSLLLFAFCGFPTIFRDNPALGLSYTEEDMHGFNHLWALFGYKLGVKDKYNMCLQPNLKRATNYYRFIWKNYYYPHLFHLSPLSKFMLEAQLGAFSIMNSQNSTNICDNLQLTPKVYLLSLLSFLGSSGSDMYLNCMSDAERNATLVMAGQLPGCGDEEEK